LAEARNARNIQAFLQSFSVPNVTSLTAVIHWLSLSRWLLCYCTSHTGLPEQTLHISRLSL